MDNIGNLFDEFAVAYQHSLYAIGREKTILDKARSNSRDQIKKRFEKDRSKIATAVTNNLMTNMHKMNDAYQTLTAQSDSVIRVAEYLAYGSIIHPDINKSIFSDCTLPWIMPFLGHKNIYIESNGNACQILGLNIVIQALIQTAPGQLQVTVINPELRPEFSSCSRLPDYKMLTKDAEITEVFASLTEEIIQNDMLLQGKHASLIGLRKEAQQPVGRLQLLIIQDIPKELSRELETTLIKIARGGPRAGIAIIYLNSKTTQKTDKIAAEIKRISNFFTFSQAGHGWKTSDDDFEKLSFSFPIISNYELTQKINDIVEASKNVSAITIPFAQIENLEHRWAESSSSNITFNLGKAGLDTISICLGDSVTQHHNILISGAAGKGKSNLIEVIIHSLCTRYSPAELELFLLDFKDGLTFKPYISYTDSSWLPHARMLGLESDRDVGLAVLKDLESERRNRALLFGDSSGGVHDFESYRRRYPERQLPRIVLIIDEYQKLFDINDEISEEASALLENLVRQGRACAIHVILASQSITGAVGLLGKEERIYAQFPVRIALQNTVSESFSIFGIGNDAAAKLRVRGEAIINENYGAVDSNKKFTVAFAAPAEMKKIRQGFCEGWQGDTYPVVFAKKDTVDYSMFIPSLKCWRAAVSEGSAIRLPCGIKLSVNKSVLPISLSNDVGRNVAILGSAEDLQAQGAVPGKNNMAIGMLQGFGVSLALQHPNGDARFIMIDGMAPDVSKNGNIERWLRLMERFGFPVEVVAAKDASEWLISYHQEMMAGKDSEDTYILGFGMDRCSIFTESDLTGESGASAFQELLKYGTEGIHFLCWWSNVTMFKNHVGFNSDGYIGTKILLRMDTDTARDILGPFVNWSVRDNRAYIHDSSDLSADSVVMPAIPIADRICGLIEAEAW